MLQDDVALARALHPREVDDALVLDVGIAQFVKQEGVLNFDLEQLRIFEEVMKSRNFTVAGEKLGIGQSSVSQQIGRLEKQVGRKLFSRTTRKVEPTSVGAAFRTYVRSMLAVAEDTRRFFDEFDVEGIAKIGIVEDFALSNLHAILALFRAQYPKFALSIMTGMSKNLVGKIDSGELDIVLGKRLPGRTNGKFLFSEPLIWCGDREIYKSFSKTRVPIVTHPEPSETRDIIVRAMEKANRKFAIIAESEGLAGIQAAVTGGFGLAAFSRRFVPVGLSAMPTDVDLPVLGNVEYMIDYREHPRDDATNALADLLTQTTKISREKTNGSVLP